MHLSVHAFHAYKKSCAGESWGGSEWDCLFHGRKKEERVTPVTQTSVFLLMYQGMVGASWIAPCVLHTSRTTRLVSDTTNEYFCLTTFLCANSFNVFFFHTKPPNPFSNHCAE